MGNSSTPSDAEIRQAIDQLPALVGEGAPTLHGWNLKQAESNVMKASYALSEPWKDPALVSDAILTLVAVVGRARNDQLRMMTLRWLRDYSGTHSGRVFEDLMNLVSSDGGPIEPMSTGIVHTFARTIDHFLINLDPELTEGFEHGVFARNLVRLREGRRLEMAPVAAT